MSYAEGTTVPVAKTRAEVEVLVGKHGATRFASGWVNDHQAGITFALRGRLVRFVLALPRAEDADKVKLRAYPWRLTGERRAKWIDAETRRRWRCLLLALKAKLEVVESGIATFEEEFLAHIVTADNLTIYEALQLQNTGQRLLEPVEEAAG